MNHHKARSEITRTDGRWRQMNDGINQQIDKWMEGWVDRWKAKGENEEYLHPKKQRLLQAMLLQIANKQSVIDN